jgi:hypothetical protein
MAKSAQRQPATVERLERCMVVLAHIIDMDGPVYLPLFNMLEEEHQTALRQRDTLSRARDIVDRYRMAGGVKAIR